MATRRTPRRRIGGWGPGHRAQLKFGSDFFGGGWGVNRWDVEDGKVDPEIVRDMRLAWESMRADEPHPWADRFFRAGGCPVNEPELCEV